MKISLMKKRIEAWMISFNAIINGYQYTVTVSDKIDRFIWISGKELLKNFGVKVDNDKYCFIDLLIVGIDDSIILNDTKVYFPHWKNEREDCDLLLPMSALQQIGEIKISDSNGFKIPCECLEISLKNDIRTFEFKSETEIVGVCSSITI